ncbi:P-loop containing nucleoside triphosphate hydrolase protein [Schizophyllum commune Tattone D]|nr:P-loop containing nucleoside triphosphate hydrolase protein [Schizophyllum commune Tattone D]
MAVPPSKHSLTPEFLSPPLIPGLLTSLKDYIGHAATPTDIQALSMKWILDEGASASQYGQYLLASETGSGKSIAYLLPVLQSVKQAEISGRPLRPSPSRLSPRALVLAPTHELARQLTSFAKGLVHDAKLRVLCTSQANKPSTHARHDRTARALERNMDDLFGVTGEEGEFEIAPPSRSQARAADVVVGTPMKILEMNRGIGWDRAARDAEIDNNGRDRRPGSGVAELATRTAETPGIGYENVEWLVVDEADILFDPDFQESTRLLMADIAAARGLPISPTVIPVEPKSRTKPVTPTPNLPSKRRQLAPSLPYNLILSSATIPAALLAYLDAHHPDMVRLVSPGLHKLPKNIRVRHVPYTSGTGRERDVEREMRRVWAEDGGKMYSKIVVFCNKSTKVQRLAALLESRGIRALALTSRPRRGVTDKDDAEDGAAEGEELPVVTSARVRGTNRYLAPFLRPAVGRKKAFEEEEKAKEAAAQAGETTEKWKRNMELLEQAPAPALEGFSHPALNAPGGSVAHLGLSGGAAGSNALTQAYTSPTGLAIPSHSPQAFPKFAPSEAPHVLITTSLLSRGLDFGPDVRTVFIMDEPRNMVDFLHRAGRTGRAGKMGEVVVFSKMKGRGSASSKDMKKRVSQLRR